MNRNKILEKLEAGFKRFYSEGHLKWSQENVIAAISTPESKRSINDPEIQGILEDLEKKGLIRLKYEEDCYLEVLHD